MNSNIASRIRFKNAGSGRLVIFLHGYKGDKNDLHFLQKYCAQKKLSYLSITYGRRDCSGKIKTIDGIDRELNAVIKYFTSKYPFKKVFFIGYSFGAAISLWLLSHNNISCQGVILISPFDDRRAFLQERKIFLSPEENLRPISIINKIGDIPLTIIHGKNDTSVNIKRSLCIFRQIKSDKALFIGIATDHYFTDKTSRGLLKKAISIAFNYFNSFSSIS